MATYPNTRQNRRVLIAAVARGELTPTDLARLLGVTDRTARSWIAEHKINWKAARVLYADRRAYSLIVGKFEPKANKRRRADKAWQEWTDEHEPVE